MLFVKKPLAVLLHCTIVLVLASSGIQPGAAAENKKSDWNSSDPAVPAITTEWSRYSWGLYYKNLAARDRNSTEREAFLKKAIQCFNDAAASGCPMDKVYFQLSECFFFRHDYATSLDYARKSLALNRTEMRIYNRIYNIYLKQKKHDAAAAILEDYLKERPESVQIMFILAEHYLKNMKDAEKATAAYKKVVSLSDQLPIEDYYKEQSCLSLANIAYRKGDLGKAAALYRSVLDMNKESLDALYFLTLTCMDVYDLAGAERYAMEFLEKRPGDRVITSILGRICYLRDDIRAVTFLGGAKNSSTMSGVLAWGLYCELIRKDDMAEKLLASVLKFSPRTISVHLAMARINARKKDASAAFNEYVTTGVLMFNSRLYEESKRCFTEAAALNGSVPGVYYYLGKVYEETQQYSLALYNYIKANSLQPDLDLMLHIGYLYGIKKDYDTAMRYFNMASVKEPSNSRPYFFKGLMSIWQEDYSTAERNIQQAISLDEKSETYYFYLAIVMEKMARLNMAIESLEKAIKNNPRSARAYNYLGYLYADNNMNIDESLTLIQKALDIEPDNGAYTDSLGWAYFRKGNYRLAIEKLLVAEEQLRKSNATDPVVYDHIGDTYLKLGRVDNALKYWRRSNEIKKTETIENKIKKYESR